MFENRIKILPEDLINKIAAGEVIERPASVVKELVENSIDAHASHITIEIQKAGKKLIRVSDDGSGMDADEIKLAVLRHSTSKIASLDDLFSIKSLGFRGEALPSIASVSKFEIISSIDADGNHLKISGGKIEEANKSASQKGTTIIVRDLFFNTPARFKFMRSETTEMAQIDKIVTRYMLAYPEISFKLTVDGRETYFSSGSAKPEDVLLEILGSDIAENMIRVDRTIGDIRVYGHISSPQISRMDRNLQSIFVNRRFVSSILVSKAAEGAFRNLIPSGRYPVLVLFVDIDPTKVDVNVHPAKREIKFSQNQAITAAVYEACRQALEGLLGPGGRPDPIGAPFKDDKFGDPASFDFISSAQTVPSGFADMAFEVTAVQPLVPIYQLNNLYVVATDGQDLVLIDQHASHERIIFDQLNKQKDAVKIQNLLVAEALELPKEESKFLNKNRQLFKEFGFDVEEFGGNTFVVRGIPAVLISAAKISQVIADIISGLMAEDASLLKNADSARDKMNKLIACHSAIKAGDKLSIQEQNKLIRDLYAAENPLTCPHGRPTMVRFKAEDIGKIFQR